MAEHFSKSVMLQDIRDNHAQLEQVLEPLTLEQLTAPGVNGSWSIKDNLAHLTAWLEYGIKLLQSIREQTTFDNPYANKEDDEVNEGIYQATKDRPYEEIHQQLQTTFQRFVSEVESLSEEQINSVPSGGKRPLAFFIIGNSNDHFQEHRTLIENWLVQQASK